MVERMWRVVAVYRIVTLCYAAVLIIHGHPSYARPAAGWVVLAIMTGWTALTTVAYSRPRGRPPWLIGTDLALAVALIMASRWVETAARISAGAPTVPTLWGAAPVLACAVAGGPWIGLAGALVICAADGTERHAILPQNTLNGIVLVLIAGGIGGYVVRLGTRAEAATDQAARREAAAAERERIARGIHDSVLQTLAMVSGRGRALGGEAAELGELAAAQETELRAMLRPGDPGAAAPGLLDTRALLEPHAGPRVTVSCPATAVPLPDETSRALAGAVAEALGNVRRHAGDGARAWVLLEDEGAQVRVSVRDDGAGFGDGRLARAAADGRLGVSHSIVGRMRQVGGTARVTSAPGQGTEVELSVPRDRRRG